MSPRNPTNAVAGHLEPFRAKIHTLNVRYLRAAIFGGGTIEDVVKIPFFLKSFPNLESLRWSCRHLNGMVPTFKLPQKLFGSSLPRLRKLSMVNCLGLLSTDTPILKVMSMECTATANRTGIYADQFADSLRCRQSITSLYLAGYHIVTNPGDAPSTVSMNGLKEIILRGVYAEDAFRYLKCPSISAVTTLRIVPLIQGAWAYNGWSVGVTATDSSGGSVSSLAHLANDAALAITWEALALVLQHSVTTLEVEDLHLIMNSATAIPKLIEVLPNLDTIRVPLPSVTRGFGVLRKILSRRHGSIRLERLVVEAESLYEARRNDEKWRALHVEYKVYGFST